jgi:uncharacterized protein with PQ loop repeat
MTETTANVAVILATVSTVVFLLPQIAKLKRTGDSSGVSTTWAALGFVSNVGWFTYMISQSRWYAVVAPLSTFIFYAVALRALAGTGRDLRNATVIAVGWSLVLGGVAVGGGWTTLGVVLGLTYAAMVTPSIWTAYRSRKPSGVSAGTWWIGSVEALLWGLYGLYHMDPGIITFGTVQLTASALMLTRYYTTRRLVLEPV